MLASIVELRWLTGLWQGKHNSEHVDEIWSMPTGDTMVGAFRQFVGTELTLYEMMVIEKSGDEIVLRIKHYGPGLTAWETSDENMVFTLKETKDKELYFTMESITGSERALHYRRQADELVVTMIVSTSKEIQKEEYTFTRLSV